MRIGVALAAGLFFVATQAFGQTADWEVVDRFRVLDRETHQQNAPTIDQDYYVQRVVEIVKARKYVPLIENEDGGQGDQLNWKTAWDESIQNYGGDWFHNQMRSVRVSVKGVPIKARCIWSAAVPQKNGQVNTRPQVENDCKPRVFSDIPLNETSEINIKLVRSNGQEITILKLEIRPTDLVIAVLGDSYVSGEGNPHLSVVKKNDNPQQQNAYPAIWWDTRCHRSLLSSAPQAAGFLAYQNKKQSVTFVSYACSGAEIMEGILEPYAGRQTIPQTRMMWQEAGQPGLELPPLIDGTKSNAPREDENKLKPQIDALHDLLCKTPANCVKPDILLIVVGGNDIAFGEIARDLILSDPPSGKQKRAAWEKKWVTALKEPLTELGARFEKLAAAVHQKIAPKNVILYEYVDPSMYGKDVLCGTANTNGGRFTQFQTEYAARSFHGRFAPGTKAQRQEAFGKNSSLFNLLITKDESKLAHLVVDGLNSEIRDASGKMWTDEGRPAHILRLQNLVGPDDLRRGLCAKNSWFIGIFDSWKKQDWIPEDPINSYPLILASEDNCGSKGGKWDAEKKKCMVAAGPLTSGILHPNFFGHYNIGQRLLSTLKEVLGAPRIAVSR
ncbi:MAG: hypothetical protein JSR72_03070 [Proteobacteria bacterium]|nr:hypothetical protein [Pseudomonadota bacterium]